ncbi:MAG TPA: hypothetical protein ENN80_00070 [Candidatus Hydrogenedentes bacterium]|nr:hypothetical protein [Candidatus Hydrogenedentota bacterium]
MSASSRSTSCWAPRTACASCGVLEAMKRGRPPSSDIWIGVMRTLDGAHTSSRSGLSSRTTGKRGASAPKGSWIPPTWHLKGWMTWANLPTAPLGPSEKPRFRPECSA